MKTFGVLTYSLDASQQGMMITKNLNDMVENYNDVCPVVFYDDYYQPLFQPFFPTIQIIDAYSFDGPLIATSIQTTQKLLKCFRSQEKYLFIMDLEWLYIKNKQFDMFKQIYMNDEIQLLARSKHHAHLIEKCWKKPLAIVEDFDYNKLYNVLFNSHPKYFTPYQYTSDQKDCSNKTRYRKFLTRGFW